MLLSWPVRCSFLIFAMNIALVRPFSIRKILRKCSSRICSPPCPMSMPWRCHPYTTFETVDRSARLFSSAKDPPQADISELKLLIPTAEDMEDVGGLIASITLEDEKAAGSIIFLMGGLGAGKTAFARGFLRAATGNVELRVTSPTYLLSNSYPVNAGVVSNKNLEVHHMDLYRLSGTSPNEFSPLNLDYVFSHCIALVEWPIRLPKELFPDNRLDITIRIIAGNGNAGDDTVESKGQDFPRELSLVPRGSIWRKRLSIIRDEGFVDDLLESKDS